MPGVVVSDETKPRKRFYKLVADVIFSLQRLHGKKVVTYVHSAVVVVVVNVSGNTRGREINQTFHMGEQTRETERRALKHEQVNDKQVGS